MGHREFAVRPPSRSAFTLIELVVVVTLITMAIGWATVDLQGVSERTRLRAAATQIGAVHRMAVMAASTSSLPRRMRWDSRSCTVAKPVFKEGAWVWGSPVKFELVIRVRIRSVGPNAGRGTALPSGPPWEFVVAPGDTSMNYVFAIETTHALRGTVRVDSYRGTESFQLERTKD